MAKYTLENFLEKCKLKHGNKFDYSKSEYIGLEKPFTFMCPVHGEVTHKEAKKHLVRSGCPVCDEEKAKRSRRGGKYTKTKGSRYELEIAKELAACGYPEVVTSRSESKRMDNAKVDLIDKENRLPFNIQCKITKNTPNYFKIREEAPKDKAFTIFWNRQEVKDGNVNMSSKGEVVMIPKEFFYELLKAFTLYNNI